MFKNRLTFLYIILLLFVFHLPTFASGGERSTVASWFIHDDPSSRTRRDATLGNGKQDATSQNELDVVAKLALQEGQGPRGRASSTTTYKIPWSVLNEGGNTKEATSASYRLKDAIGQPVIGRCESASYKAYIGFWAAKSLWIVGVEEMQEARGRMQETKLSQNYPNPFTERTSIQYAVAGRQRKDKNLATDYYLPTTLKIFDLSGRLVKTFDLTNNQSSFNQVVWDGKDDSGKEVTSGVYFYRLIAGDYSSTKKLILLR